MRTVFFSTFMVASLAFGQAGNFVAPATGYLWASHGDMASDQNGTAIAVPPAAKQVSDDDSGGNSGKSLGCTSNGTHVACKIDRDTPHIRVYNADMRILCTAARVSCAGAYGPCIARVPAANDVSVPIIAADGSIFIADSAFATRITPGCTVAWQTPVPVTAGMKSTKVTPAGDYFATVGRSGAPLVEYDASTGAVVGIPLYPSTAAQGGTPLDFYVSTNDVAAIPGVAGGGAIGPPGTLMRIYYAGQNTNLSQPNSRMFAIDVSAEGMTVAAWSAPFWGPNEVTPMWHDGTIYSDTCSTAKLCTGPGSPGPQIIAFHDDYPAPRLTIPRSFNPANPGQPLSAPGFMDSDFSYVPSGCFLTRYFHRDLLDCRNPITGLTTGGPPEFSIGLDGILGNDEPGTIAPIGDVTITTDGRGHNVALMGVEALSFNHGYVLALRLDNQTLLWSYRLPSQPNNAAGQFPLVNGRLGPEVCFSSTSTGPQCLGLEKRR
jgi:hypothetical protein